MDLEDTSEPDPEFVCGTDVQASYIFVESGVNGIYARMLATDLLLRDVHTVMRKALENPKVTPSPVYTARIIVPYLRALQRVAEKTLDDVGDTVDRLSQYDMFIEDSERTLAKTRFVDKHQSLEQASLQFDVTLHAVLRHAELEPYAGIGQVHTTSDAYTRQRFNKWQQQSGVRFY